MDSNYEKLAPIYDYLMQGVDYEAWGQYVADICTHLDFTPSRVLDLACGTGNGALALAKRGYQVSGVDISPEMLALARAKAQRAGLKIDFSAQDMRFFSLPEKVDLVVIFQDGINYLLHTEDLRQTFTCIREALNPGGIFAFDLLAVNRYQSGEEDTTVVEEADFTLIWQSSYAKDLDVWEISLQGFVEKSSGFYEKFKEVHREKYHSPEEVIAILKEEGFSIYGVFEAFTLKEEPNARRQYVIARI